MKPKEKAKQLVGKFYVNIPLRDCDNRRPHKLALIAVDELIKQERRTDDYYEIGSYWREVKKEIELL